MERNIIIENICTACHCGERRAEEYLAVELRNLRELRDAGALCYGDLETACSGLGGIGKGEMFPRTTRCRVYDPYSDVERRPAGN
ncbi:hypothetical protein F2Q99_14795 [Alistipes onderdonkii]|nr:hypothetical protein F2Q99_14795 [Alistipes onderdonkii]